MHRDPFLRRLVIECTYSARKNFFLNQASLTIVSFSFLRVCGTPGGLVSKNNTQFFLQLKKTKTYKDKVIWRKEKWSAQAQFRGHAWWWAWTILARDTYSWPFRKIAPTPIYGVTLRAKKSPFCCLAFANVALKFRNESFPWGKIYFMETLTHQCLFFNCYL